MSTDAGGNTRKEKRATTVSVLSACSAQSAALQKWSVVVALICHTTLAMAQITNYTVLHSFNATNSEGGYPMAGLTEGTDGMLYGTTAYSGIPNNQLIFQINKDGTGYGIVRRFSGNIGGIKPLSEVLDGNDGWLYGCTAGGGTTGYGVIYRATKSGSVLQPLYNFGAGTNDGAIPQAGLIKASDGLLYGTTSTGFHPTRGIVFAINPANSNYNVLHRFTGTPEPSRFEAPVIEGSDGWLYGTAMEGGTNNLGAVFKIKKSGTEWEVLHHFQSPDNRGTRPNVALLEASDGWLYGMTDATIFRLTRSGSNFTVLHDFAFASSVNGSGPYGPLVEGNDGLLYGTTRYSGFANHGVIFRLNKDGSSFTLLHRFGQAAGDGTAPYAGLLKGSDGKFYGTTWLGGEFGYGTVFRFEIVSQFPSITSQPAHITNVLGSNATFSVAVTGAGPFSYQWRKDGLLLNDGSSIAGSRSNVLTLSGLSLADAGNYSVAVSNSVGSVTSVTARLVVIVPPMLVRGPWTDDSNLVAHFVGTPGITYQLQRTIELPALQWQSHSNIIAPATDEGHGIGVFEIREPIVPSELRRFYRLRYPPVP